MGLLYLFVLFSFVSGNDVTLDVTALSQQDYCTDPQPMLVDTQKCLDAYNIPLKMPSVDELSSTSNPSFISDIKNPTFLADMCRRLDAYQKSQVCVQNILSKCTQAPSLDFALIKKIQEYVCANLNIGREHKYLHERNSTGLTKHGQFKELLCPLHQTEFIDGLPLTKHYVFVPEEFNITCMSDMASKIVDCSSTFKYMTTNDYVYNNFTEIDHKETCMSEKLLPVCRDKYLPTCGEATRHVYEMANPNSTECLTPNSLDTPTVDCSTTGDIRTSYHQCFIYNGILFQFPENLTSEDTSQHIMHAITMDDNMCSNLKAYQQAVSCTLQVQKQCSDDVMKPRVADSKTVLDGLAKLCGHIRDFDTKCVRNAPRGSCGGRHRALDSKHLCAASRTTQNCLVSAVSSCSKTTVSMYNDVLLSQSPALCLKQATGSHLIG